MLVLHHSLPPFSSFSTSTKIPPCSPPPHINPTTSSKNSNVVCARSEDDYHSTLKALNSRGRTPRKSLGQHYMLNPSINERLVEAADVKDGDVVLEIGPGTGSLTNVLINAGATVLAIEKDPHMATLVEERFATTQRFMDTMCSMVVCWCLVFC